MLSSAAIALGTRDTALCNLYSAFDSLEVRPLPGVLLHTCAALLCCMT